MTVTRLRENIYNVIDQVLETGEPVEVERNGRVVRIVPDKPISRIERLKRRKLKAIIGDPESIVHMDWSKYWNEVKNLK